MTRGGSSVWTTSLWFLTTGVPAAEPAKAEEDKAHKPQIQTETNGFWKSFIGCPHQQKPTTCQAISMAIFRFSVASFTFFFGSALMDGSKQKANGNSL